MTLATEANIQFSVLSLPWLKHVLAIERSVYDYPWPEEVLQQALAGEFDVEGAITSERDLMGYLMTMQVVDEVHIINFAIAKKWQRQGIGTQLLKRLHAKEEARATKFFFLDVASQNQVAVNFYKRHGYKPIGLRKAYYHGSGDDAIVMQRLAGAKAVLR